MTDADQDRADEQAVHALTHRLQHIPPSILADPAALSRRFIADMRANGWYHRDVPPSLKPAEKNPDAYERGALLAREALRKDQRDA